MRQLCFRMLRIELAYVLQPQVEAPPSHALHALRV